ncbi:HAMP domain-containing protein [Aeromonas schubertii]|uniref:HAMP domain-containing protein n=1 Tax=Aeromonas schubertii TaxID=652 RepID=UPI00067E6DE3|nr:HAMP domain-containing protein [Aeromonas schubertii]KUE80214.1 HAMP domain-containing protein [Aeromonas schubertii]MBZ6071116.1 HAMP domain-containing protein [Aeromonas schubertii]
MRLSIAAKLNFFLLFIFSMVLVFSAAYQAVRERGLILDLVKEQSQEQTEAYFDSLNLLMLTGKMSARDTLREKFLKHSHVEEARVIRAEAVNTQFGAGRAQEQARDDVDRQALAGQATLEVVQEGIHSRLVATLPLRASKEYRGTDCTACHQVPEGTVLGAVRIDYSLDPLFAQVERSILGSTLILTAIFSLGLLLTLWVLRTWVVNPLAQLTRAMEEATDRHDFGHRLDYEDTDEIGRVAVAYNQMLDSVEQQLALQQASTQVIGSESPQQHHHQ